MLPWAGMAIVLDKFGCSLTFLLIALASGFDKVFMNSDPSFIKGKGIVLLKFLKSE